ncbi:hypothetical protein CI109_105861 [Kwoniella shandongensis]|uniref:Uncharacterized protein n=1 Tax=Kwoniella shandongensis TaxID=1734106 RepID=A0A5M6BT23_9TREE|nr:uncharacterized protein CI109_005704 [Kwoniella shandongensis]KAA5525957.1 hypothetical protein CI109_005704 [Kwoniella shandongensis]
MSAPNPSSSSTNPTPTLFPTLYSLLPPSLHPTLLSHLSLLSIHAEQYYIIDRIYTTTNPVVSGQLRNLRFRSRRRKSTTKTDNNQSNSDGAVGKEGKETAGEWLYTLEYVSAPLRSAEYSEASVRAIIGIEIKGMSGKDEVEEFITAMGFQHSHTYTLSGLLFHIPIPAPSNPPLTLQITITNLIPLSSATPTSHPTTISPTNPSLVGGTEPYLVQIHPSRPVNPVPIPGDVGLQDMIGLMRDLAGRVDVDGLEWSTGSMR